MSGADPDLLLRGGSDSVLLALPVVLPFVIFFFLAQNSGGAPLPRAPPLDPPLSVHQAKFKIHSPGVF